MLAKGFFLSILFALAWGTVLFLPVVPPQCATAQPVGVPAQASARVQAGEPAKPSPTRVRKPGTAPLVMNRRLVLKLRQRRVYVQDGDKVLVSYRVAVGKRGWETPTGSFKVIQMVRNPAWKNPWSGKLSDPGPKSALGERWIGFWTDGKNSIGFHGTPGEHLLGQAVSHGCVRMRNADIKAMFDMVEMGTTVIVQP
jgi:L,D-transpeptidase ErfK/SrfK